MQDVSEDGLRSGTSRSMPRPPAAGSMRCWRRPSRLLPQPHQGPDSRRRTSRSMAKPSPSRTTGSRRARRSSSPPRPRSTPTPSPRTSRSTILYEDDAAHRHRQAGRAWSSTPRPAISRGTLVNALLYHCGDSLAGIGGVKRPGIVHRLDKDTSGVMVAAKTERAHAHLAAQFADHGRTGPLHRAYTAFAWGATEQGHGTVNAPLGRDAEQPAEAGRPPRRPRGDHPLRRRAALRRRGLGHHQAQLRARNRPHPPDPRAYGAYRPSAGRRPALRPRLRHQGQPPAGAARKRPSWRSAGRRCTRRSLGLSTR